MSTVSDARISQVMEQLGVNHTTPNLPVHTKKPGMLERLFDPEAKAHYDVVKANEHTTVEVITALRGIGLIATDSVAVRLESVHRMEGIMNHYADSALVSAYAPGAIAQAIELMDAGTGRVLETGTNRIADRIRNRR